MIQSYVLVVQINIVFLNSEGLPSIFVFIIWPNIPNIQSVNEFILFVLLPKEM